MRPTALLLAAATAALLSGCSGSKESGPLGSPDNPIQMAFVPSLETGQITVSANALAEDLEEKTGYTINVTVPVSYAAVIEAMKAGRAHVAWYAPLSYVLAHSEANAEVLLISERDGEIDYFGAIVVRKDSGITAIDQLKGKKFAFVDPMSTSGTLYPQDLLIRSGINPETDLQSIYAGGHDKALIALYNKQVDAASCYAGHISDARDRVEATIPDIFEKTTVLAKTAPIPNDNVSVRSDLPEEVKQKLKEALLEISGSEEGKKMLMDVAQISGLRPVEDSVYDTVRDMARTLGLDIKETVQQDKPK